MGPIQAMARATHSDLTVRTAARSLLERLVEDESGHTQIEYGLIAAFMGTSLITALFLLQGSLETFYTTMSSLLDAVR